MNPAASPLSLSLVALPAALISPGVSLLVQIAVIMVIFYLLLIRPQARKQREHQKMVDNLTKGDRILTSGGLYANVLNVKDNLIVATIADGVKVELAKSAVATRVDTSKPGAPEKRGEAPRRQGKGNGATAAEQVRAAEE